MSYKNKEEIEKEFNEFCAKEGIFAISPIKFFLSQTRQADIDTILDLLKDQKSKRYSADLIIKHLLAHLREERKKV